MILKYITRYFKILLNGLIHIYKFLLNIVFFFFYSIAFAFVIIKDFITWLFIPPSYKKQYKQSSEGEIHSIKAKHVIPKSKVKEYNKKHNIEDNRYVMISKQNTDGTLDISNITSVKPRGKYKKMYVKIHSVKMKINPSYIDKRTLTSSRHNKKRFKKGEKELLNKPFAKVNVVEFKKHTKQKK